MMKLNNRARNILLALRVFLGILFLYSGVSKLVEGFSAEGYLINATSGPFKEIFASMAGSGLVDSLVVYGEIGIGISLLLGFFLRFGALSGALMMALFYLSILPGEYGPIDDHIIYILVFALLAATGAGRYIGLDKYIEKLSFVKRSWGIFKFLLG